MDVGSLGLSSDPGDCVGGLESLALQRRVCLNKAFSHQIGDSTQVHRNSVRRKARNWESLRRLCQLERAVLSF